MLLVEMIARTMKNEIRKLFREEGHKRSVGEILSDYLNQAKVN